MCKYLHILHQTVKDTEIISLQNEAELSSLDGK